MTALLVIIYLAFIGLGLPDSLLGSAWPVMQGELGASLGLAGLISMVVSAGTVVASLSSSRLISRFGTALVTLVSVALTAIALLGISMSGSVWLIFAMAVPLGLGAGSVDAALNNFVALHYKAMHMSWLHCFWGIGATAGPMIMSLFLSASGGWKMGYRTIAIIQFLLVAVLLFSLPHWRKAERSDTANQQVKSEQLLTNRQALALPCIKLSLCSFIFYCGVELMAGLWSSSYFVATKGLSTADAARCASFFYGSITVGRLAAGFLTMRIRNVDMIRLGQVTCVIGAVLMLLPVPGAWLSILGLMLIGLGAAPIYPSMLHETPNRFGKDASQTVMGLQMAFAYIGSTLLPPIIGGIATGVGIWVLPWALLFGAVAMLLASEQLRRRLAH